MTQDQATPRTDAVADFTAPEKLFYVARELERENVALQAALKETLTYICTEVTACNGMKCRELNCESCFGDSAEQHVKAAREASRNAQAMLTERNKS